jgi:phosphotransferase system enzyme I (PtsI)
VTIRTLDIGADKPLDQTEHTALNPALGLRAIRYCLAQPQLFLTQLRAILRAAAYGPVRVLVPMICCREEMLAVAKLLEAARVSLLADDLQAGERVELGAMIEVPAAALALPLLLKHFDFVSIGTNDLIQYTLAIDRADEAVSHLYDPWHPAVLGLIAQTIACARAAGKGVSVCGEMAGDPEFTDLLLAMGLRNFSMHPSQISSIKQRVLRADTRRLAPLLPTILNSEDPASVCRRAQASLQAVGIHQ